MTHLTLTPAQFRAHQERIKGRKSAADPNAGSDGKPSSAMSLGVTAGETAKPDRWPLVLRDQIVAAGLPEPLREACFHPTRGWRSDLSWPDRRIAVEIEGQAHSIKGKREADCNKHNAYMLLGWRYLRVLPRWVETGQALSEVRELLA